MDNADLATCTICDDNFDPELVNDESSVALCPCCQSTSRITHGRTLSPVILRFPRR